MFSLTEMTSQLKLSVINCMTLDKYKETRTRLLKLSTIDDDLNRDITNLLDDQYKILRANADKQALSKEKAIEKKEKRKRDTIRFPVYGEQLSIEEAAIKYGLPVTTVRSRKSSGQTLEQSVSEQLKRSHKAK